MFIQREERDSQRLAQILDFARKPGCITRRLLGYFGEALEDESCGHCHYCRKGEPAKMVELPATRIPDFSDEDEEQIRELIFEEHAPLSTPRQVTRYLCGLTSPATTRARLTRNPLFGRFAQVPFRKVFAIVEAQMAEI